MKIQQQTGRVLLLIVWIMLMLGIFWFSAQDASTSTKESVAVGTLICRIFDQGYEELTPSEQLAMAEAIDHAVRKSAHFCEYMLLGMLTAGVAFTWLRTSGGGSRGTGGAVSDAESDDCGRRGRVKDRRVWYAFLWCICYAASDEVHQRFVPGRYGMWQDVVLDSAGALAGILIVYALFNRAAHHPASRKE